MWPWKKGTARGIACNPLYPSVEVAERNPALGELLALFDAVRGGSAREEALALAAPVVRQGPGHRDVIARSQRFPHRNAALGRVSSVAELAFLQTPGSRF